MPKQTSVYICQNCGYESPKWVGQCPECASWNTLVEEERVVMGGKRQISKSNQSTTVIRFSDVKDYDRERKRLLTNMSEFDRVLGGGIVFGSVVMIGGEPGIGKSTLLTHLTLNILNNSKKSK